MQANTPAQVVPDKILPAFGSLQNPPLPPTPQRQFLMCAPLPRLGLYLLPLEVAPIQHEPLRWGLLYAVVAAARLDVCRHDQYTAYQLEVAPLLVIVGHVLASFIKQKQYLSAQLW